MSDPLLNRSAMEECLETLKHLRIDIARLKPEPGYEPMRGGYCDLHVARLDPEIPGASKLVAMKKLLLSSRSSEPWRLAVRVVRELKVWSGLHHPHVLPVLGFCLGNDYKTAVLISEYMANGDLKEYIAKMEPTYFERLHLARDLTDGLVYLHTQTAPIRHGDLKPGNVLVNSQRRALLADFGLSRALNAAPTGLTTDNDGRSTVRFASPEFIFEGAAAQSLANDIWSWGCLVLEVMANKKPFAGLTLESHIYLAHIKHQTPCDVKALALDPPQFNDLLVKCWDRDPNERPKALDCLRLIQSALPSFWPEPQQEPRPLLDPVTLRVPSTQSNLHSSVGSNRMAQHVQFHEVFTTAFNHWLTQRKLTLDVPRVNDKPIELHKLFVMVGALGGYRSVFEKAMWPMVGAKIGFSSSDRGLPSCKPEVADQLSKIYQKILADFEVHWYNSLRPDDRTSIFPLPPDLQYLSPEIERLPTGPFWTSKLLVNFSPLEGVLESLNHLFIDVARLKLEPDYGVRRGGYCDFHVATLDPAIPGASKLVAVKKLFLWYRSTDPLGLAFRLVRELKVWERLRHPHVLPVLGFYLGEDYQTAVLISEYMVYGDVKSFITKERPDRLERLQLVRDLTDGLAYLHTQTPPIRHGDLKPGNVLVNPQRRALLAGFGLSTALGAGPTGFTTGNDLRGTIRFSSPEILLDGVAAQSLANDMWSWACLVLEVMTEKIPFHDILPEPHLIIALVQGRAPCDADILARDLPQFSDLLGKCWSRDPNLRPTAVDCLRNVQYEVSCCSAKLS